MSLTLSLCQAVPVFLFAQAGPGPVDLPFAFAVNVPIVQVTAGGKPAQFILDTGAGTSVVDAEFADQIDLHASYIPKYGRFVFHFPRVKSGNASGAPPCAIDASDMPITALIVSES